MKVQCKMENNYKTADEEYMLALNGLRSRLDEVRDRLLTWENEYKDCVSDQSWAEAEYQFALCTKFLASENLHIERVDSEVGMLSLLNDLRATSAPPELIAYMTRYWERLQQALQAVKDLSIKLQQQVLTKILMIYDEAANPYMSHLVMMAENRTTTMAAVESIKRLSTRMNSLLDNYQNNVDRNDLEAGSLGPYAMASLPRDIRLKMSVLVDLSDECLNRDEKFVSEITCTLFDYRRRSRECQVKLSEHRQTQLENIKNTKTATIQLQKSKEQLRKLEKELQDIEGRSEEAENKFMTISKERERDASAIEFLEHAIATTKRNNNLKLKRQHLIRTKAELDRRLAFIEQDLKIINDTRQQKVTQKQDVENSVESSHSQYLSIKQQLDHVADVIAAVEQEAASLTEQLSDIEALHNLKTSPETVDELADYPTTVRLADSVLKKILTTTRVSGTHPIKYARLDDST